MPKYRWYIEITSVEINTMLAGTVSDQNFCKHMCADGEIRRLCECDKVLLDSIRRKANQDNLTICVWKRIGNGRIVRHHDEKKKKERRVIGNVRRFFKTERLFA